MAKILSRSGASLADIYDVAGSIAGIDTLESKEVSLVHEMGATIFSERFTTQIRRESAADRAQNTSWNIIITDLPAQASRILGITVFIDTTARVNLASVAVRSPGNGRETPIWSWDSAIDVESQLRLSDDGGAAATVLLLRPALALTRLPTLLAGREAVRPNARVSEVSFRGRTTGFGAGTVSCTMLLYQGLVDAVTGVSSRGLPIPSW